jgi:HK97 family phage major capsid protein
MPTYNSLIDRSDASALMPEEVSRQIIESLPEQSAVLRLFRHVTMSRAQQRMPVLAALATAYFVNGDTGLKQTTEISWTNKYLNAEEIAVIVPVPQAVLDDADYDIWGEVRPRIVEAFGRVLDAAVLFGVNKPASWPDDIVTAATSAGNAVALGTGADLVDDIGGENGVMAKVEEDGFDVSFFIAAPIVRAKLRGLRTADGALIYQPAVTATTPSTLYGQPLEYVQNGAWDAASALLICGDRSQGIIGIRQDIQMKVLDQAVIQDGTGAIVYNLAQQDMVALRVTMRVGFQVANPITNLQPTEANRYPFAVLTP